MSSIVSKSTYKKIYKKASKQNPAHLVRTLKIEKLELDQLKDRVQDKKNKIKALKELTSK